MFVWKDTTILQQGDHKVLHISSGHWGGITVD